MNSGIGIKERAQRELGVKIADLYRVFARYPRPTRVQDCLFEWYAADPEGALSKPLRQMTVADLGHYAERALTTRGTVDDYRYFLPRLLELATTGPNPGRWEGSTYSCARWTWPRPEVLLGKLAMAGWQTWLGDEQNAIRAFLRAWWHSVVTEFPSPADVGELLCGVALCADVSPYLEVLSALCPHWLPARRQLVTLVYHFVLDLEERIDARQPFWHGACFWEEQPARLREVLLWLLDERTALFLNMPFLDRGGERALSEEPEVNMRLAVVAVRAYRVRRAALLQHMQGCKLLSVPELALVVLIGPSGSGKSTFARRHFKLTEVLSSDVCRGLVADDETDQSVTAEAFAVLHFIAAKRLAAGKLTVIDATNVQPEARKPLVALAREYHCLPVAIVFDLPEKLCQERNAARADRDFGPHVIRQQRTQLRRSLRGLQREGFRHVFTFETPEEVEAAIIERQPLWNNLRHEHGPFDIIGDVHGCFDELVELLDKLGYRVEEVGQEGEVPAEPLECAAGGGALAHPEVRPPKLAFRVTHPGGRKVLFLGDIVDRGLRIADVLRLVMSMTADGVAWCVPGNHDMKLMRQLRGKQVQLTHGLAESVAQLEAEPAEFRARVAEFIDGLVSHYVLDDGKLVVAHAGMKAEMQGRGSGKVREFALYGETTGETDEFGLPVRCNWAAEYRGRAMVVYGHTPVPEPEWLNRTINIDTGCVFGGKLTALRYPEKELVSVPARRVYAEPRRPFLAVEALPPALTAQQQHDDVLDLSDVQGKRIIATGLHHNVTIREENAAAALEVMSRFAADPKWLIYLPPTMSPCETAQQPHLLEHPAEAFAYYRQAGVPHVVCEEKHMGSRAVVIVCRDADAARRRFGVADEVAGICFTRTGRRFFEDVGREAELLARVQAALTAAGAWDELRTDWVCLDCELLPWSAKAQALLQQQYAAVGAASGAALAEVTAALESAQATGLPVAALLERHRERAGLTARYVQAYRRYCWPVDSVADLKLAPFHVLATEGHVHIDRDHVWHMETLTRWCAVDSGLLLATPYRVVDLTDPASTQAGIDWWAALTGKGGEGMVVKPLTFIARGRRGLVQPAVKCRGREYLRIIYGPEYTRPENLERLRARGLAAKRSLALREFALGIEGLERFVRGEPLRRVHECVFGVLALESEPVDPRL
jgi:protein phosphatase